MRYREYVALLAWDKPLDFPRGAGENGPTDEGYVFVFWQLRDGKSIVRLMCHKFNPTQFNNSSGVIIKPVQADFFEVMISVMRYFISFQSSTRCITRTNGKYQKSLRFYSSSVGWV